MKSTMIAICPIILLFFFGCSSDDGVNSENSSIDFAVQTITYKMDPISNTTGMLTIKGSIINVSDDFISNDKHQTIYLFERNAGLPSNNNGELVGQLDFSQLKSGETVSVEFERMWDTSLYPVGSMCPEYRLVIAKMDDFYGLGIKNIDSNPNNNTLDKSGMGINILLGE